MTCCFFSSAFRLHVLPNSTILTPYSRHYHAILTPYSRHTHTILTRTHTIFPIELEAMDSPTHLPLNNKNKQQSANATRQKKRSHKHAINALQNNNRHRTRSYRTEKN